VNEINNYFLELEEPNKSCYFALRTIILNFSTEISEHWKYRIPFYYFKGKPFCYFYQDKKTKHPYIGIVKGSLINHHMLFKGDRKKMKIFMVDPNKDIPINEIQKVFEQASKFYK